MWLQANWMTAMPLEAIYRRSTAQTAAGTVRGLLKFERTGQPGLHDKFAMGPAAAALLPVHPLFVAAFYYLFTPAAYSTSQNLIFLVMS